MCGIFGFVVREASSLSDRDIEGLTESLFSLSQARGSEAAGIAVSTGTEIRYFRRALPAARMLKTSEYGRFIAGVFRDWGRKDALAVVGHSRLVTNGTQGIDENNQPVASDHSVGVHNGIVVNDTALWASNKDLHRRYKVDTEVLYRLIDKHYAGGLGLPGAIAATYGEIEGEANIAFLHDAEPALGLATNVGSLYFSELPQVQAFIFASERYFLRRLLAGVPLSDTGRESAVVQLPAGTGMLVRHDLSVERFQLAPQPAGGNRTTASPRKIVDASPRRPGLRRCTRCVLPHTFPFIRFDENGVCNYCREDVPRRADSPETLERRIAPYRSKNGSPDCIVALSGGRDSCYGLHYIKRELGMNPIAYTYDWAMVTDEARRNCARVCGALSVEHIIRSADISSKRRNIRMNIEAWLRRPQLGMIPLFMAGDKQFFHYASEVSRQTEVPLVFFCGGNNLEITRFKAGFCGVKDRSIDTMVGLDTVGKLRLLAYYAKNYVLNPLYLNRSIFDTLFAFYSTYLGRKDFIYLYRYVEWNERIIADTLREAYGWESASDSTSTWRIGDGTAAFYNYIYHTVAGFSEHDTFRSNQIRAGLITRGEALRLIEVDNQPRYAAMCEYAQLVGFNLDEALSTINNIPKLA
jgi:glucosamine--fructose-6-phosphate aminotransferase (isomerizing)